MFPSLVRVAVPLTVLLAIIIKASLYYFQLFETETTLSLVSEPVCKELQGYCIARQETDGTVKLPAQTPYWNSSISFDESGLPFSKGPDQRTYRNVSSIALRISARGQEYGLVDGCVSLPMGKIQRAGLAWLEANALPLKDAIVWHYNYDTQVNDVVVSAGWPSAFAQAAVINRLLMAACTTHEQKYLDLARKAGKALLIPVSEGGLRSNNDNFVWFQEIPISDEHAPFILNAHLYSIFSLLLLDKHFPNDGFRDAALRGLDALDRALPTLDNGYWNRYDLRPRYPAANFRLDGGGHKIWSVSLTQGGKVSKIDFPTGKREPEGNSLWGNVNPSGDGNSLVFGEKVYAQFILLEGRIFDPALLRTPSRLVVAAECCGKKIKAYGFGFRPNLSEYYEAREIDRTPQGTLELISFETGMSDYAWGQVAQEYIPFHAELMGLISRLAARPNYLTYAYRWQNFHRNWLRDKDASRNGELLRERHVLTSADELGAALDKRFGRQPLHTVTKEELMDLVQDAVIARIGSACNNTTHNQACDLQQSFLSALALNGAPPPAPGNL